MRDKKALIYFREHKVSFALSFLFLLVLSFSLTSYFVSSNELTKDNLKYYNEDLSFDLVATDSYYSHLTKDTIVLKGTLTSHKSVNEIKKVGIGYQLVMEYQLETSLDALGGILSDVYFYDGETNQLTEKDYYIAYKQELEGFNQICTEYDNISLKDNQTQNCLIYENQSYTYYQWTPYNSKDIPKGVLTLGLFVYCEEGDYLDGVWSFGGNEITKHAYWNASLDNGIIAYYKLDETSGTTAEDSTGNYTGTANNERIFTAESEGIINGAGNFSQGNDYISNVLPNNAFDSTDFTINSWVLVTNKDATTNYILSAQSSGNDGLNFQIHDDKIRLTIYNGTFFTTDSGAIITENLAWYMVTIVLDGSNTYLYMNGTSVMNDTKGAIFSPVVNYSIGRNQQVPSYFSGLIDEVGVWNRALTADEVELLYNSGDGLAYGDYGLPFGYEGSGTALDPYKIINWSGLYYVRNNLTAYYILNNSLSDATSDYSDFNTGSGWEPIGNGTTFFSGDFDGNDKTIEDLFINRSGEDYLGLFGYVGGGDIYDLNLKYVNIVGNNTIGSLAGRSEGIVTDCSVTFLLINGTGNYIGGLVGRNVGYIDDSWVKMKFGDFVTGYNYVGGLTGLTIEADIMNSYVSKNSFTDVGLIEGHFYVGGLTGSLVSSTIEDSSIRAGINIEGDSWVGGLTGESKGSTISEIINSYGTPYQVYGNNYIGGLIGESINSTLTDLRFYSSDVIGEGAFVGGITGSSEDDVLNNISVYDSYILNNDESESRTGGIAGKLDGSVAIYLKVNDTRIVGYEHTGGIAGYIRDYEEVGNLSQSYVTYSNITGTTYVGGIAGEVDRDSSNAIDPYILVTDSYSMYNRLTGTNYVGGTTGYISENGFYCNRIQNILNVNTYYSYSTNGGAIVGDSDCANTTLNSFWDYTLYAGDSEWGINATTEELQDINLYDNYGWDIKETNTTRDYAFLGFEEENETTWLIDFEEVPEENPPVLLDTINDSYICPNETGTINLNNFYSNWDNNSLYIIEILYYEEINSSYNEVYLTEEYPTFTIYADVNSSSTPIITFTMNNGILTFDTEDDIHGYPDNPLVNEIGLIIAVYNEEYIGITHYSWYGTELVFNLTLNNETCWTEIIPDIPDEDTEEEIEGWFGSIINWFLSLFPDSEDLSTAQKVGIVIISMIIITIILLAVTWSSETGIPSVMIYLTGFINFMLLVFFIAVGYVPIIIVILLFLILLALGWFKLRSGSGGGE